MSQIDNTDFKVDIDDIHRSGVINNIRTHFNDSSIKELAESIYEIGLMQSVVVMQAEDDEGENVYALVAGERRIRAIQYIQQNLDTDFMEDGVPCVEFTGDIGDAQFANALENIDREDVDDVDIAAWIYARVQDNLTQTKLAEKLHKPLQWVNFRHSFHERSCPELKDLLREGLISFTAAYELSKNLDEEAQKKKVTKARKFNEKISLEEAQNAGNPNKSAKPSKKQRGIILAQIEGLAETSPNPLYRGASTALRWVDGLISDEEMEEFLEFGLEDAGEED